MKDERRKCEQPPFSPDSPLVDAVMPSPNQEARRNRARPDMIILHYTGMPDAEAALRRLCAAESRVSAHYFVFEDGRIVQCVPESRRAWHAGESSWAGDTDVNSRAIGIEIANPGHDHGYRDFPPSQIAALIALCRDIIARNAVRPERVLAHSDVAPARKQDPGEKFPWEELHRGGVGHWVAPAAVPPRPALRRGSRGKGVRDLQEKLAAYGYGLAVSGRYDTATACVVAAFQRHFRPARVDGIADAATMDTLDRLLAAQGRPRPRAALTKRARIPTKGMSVGRTAAPRARPKGRRGGKSGLRGPTVPDNVRRG